MALIDIPGMHLEVVALPPPTALAAPAPKAEPLQPIVFLHEGLGSVAMWRDWPAAVCQATAAGLGVFTPRLWAIFAHTRQTAARLPAPRGVGRAVRLAGAAGCAAAGAAGPFRRRQHRAAVCQPFPRGGVHRSGAAVVVEDVSIQSTIQARDAFRDPVTGLRERLARHHADVDSAFWQWNDAWLNPAFRTFDIREDCRRISAPVLAIQGVDDPYGTMAQIDQIELPAARIRRPPLVACGYSPHRDQTQLTTQAITGFLERLG